MSQATHKAAASPIVRGCTGINYLNLPKEKNVAGTMCPVLLLRIPALLCFLSWTRDLDLWFVP